MIQQHKVYHTNILYNILLLRQENITIAWILL